MGDGNKLVTVSCAEHHETLVERLWHFFKTGKGLDFDFPRCSGGRPVLAHLLVVDAFMSPRSFSYIREGNEGGDSEASDTLDSLLEFMYRGTVSVPEDELQDLLETAKVFDFKMLVNSIENVVNKSARVHMQQLSDVVEPVVGLGILEGAGSDIKLGGDLNIGEAKDASSQRKVRPKKRKRAAFESTSVVAPPAVASGRACVAIPSAPATALQLEVGVTLVKCSVCGRKLAADVDTLRSHRCVDRFRFRCQLCLAFKSNDEARYQLHLSTHDAVNAKPVVQCRTCRKPFLTAEELSAHETTRHPASATAVTYSCSLCKYESQVRCTYNHHLFKRHSLDIHGQPLCKKLRCEQCDFRCVRPSELRRHVTVHHSTERPFKCPLCPFAAALNQDLYIHNRRIHLGIKNYPCNLCELRFHSNYALDRHRRTHTGERPFICEVCGKAYADSTTLKWHVRGHKEGSDRTHICHICGHLAKRRQYLKAHLKNVHKLNAPTSVGATAKSRAKSAASRREVTLASPVDFSHLVTRQETFPE